MKKKFILSVFTLFLIAGLSPVSMAAGTNPLTCDTRYPIVLAHGMGVSAEVLGIIDVWWGIQEALEDEGAVVFKTSVNGMDSTADKAADFKQQVMEILAVTGAEKINIIGHSHGTLYTRYAISNLGLAPYVASYTSLGGPHRGSAIADLIMYEIPDWLLDAGGEVIDFVYAFVFGDTDPDVLQNGSDLCTDFMTEVFNPNTPDVPGIYYQSWAFKVKTMPPNIIMEPTWLALLAIEGANDGMVSVNSAKWGNFRGVEDAAWYSSGCDHLNTVGHLFGYTPGFDAPQFFVDVVADLKTRNF
jgi:triacylglycerol lipase